MSMFQPTPRPPRPFPMPPRPPMPTPENDGQDMRGLPSRGRPSPRAPQRGGGDGGMMPGPRMERERPSNQEILDMLGMNRDGSSRNQRQQRSFPFPRREGTDPRLPFRPEDGMEMQTLPFRPGDEMDMQTLPFRPGDSMDMQTLPFRPNDSRGMAEENVLNNVIDPHYRQYIALMRAMQGMN